MQTLWLVAWSRGRRADILVDGIHFGWWHGIEEGVQTLWLVAWYIGRCADTLVGGMV